MLYFLNLFALLFCVDFFFFYILFLFIGVGLIFLSKFFFLWLVFIRLRFTLIPLSFKSSDFCPFNFALMEGLIATHHLNLILKFLTFDSSSCSLFALIGDKKAFVYLLLGLFLFVHLLLSNNHQFIQIRTYT